MKAKTIVLVVVTLLVVVAAWKVSEEKAPQTEVTRALRTGEIDHALVVAAFAHFALRQTELRP